MGDLNHKVSNRDLPTWYIKMSSKIHCAKSVATRRNSWTI